MIDNLTNSNAIQLTQVPELKKAKITKQESAQLADKDSSFVNELAQAESAAQAVVLPQVSQLPQMPSSPKSEQVAQIAARNARAEGLKASSSNLFGMRGMATAEEAPTTQRQAAGVNAGATIAGPKPWSRDWVFSGMEEQNPDLHTLFPSKSETGNPMAVLNQYLKDAMGGEAKAESLKSGDSHQKIIPELAVGTGPRMQAAKVDPMKVDAKSDLVDMKQLDPKLLEVVRANSDSIPASPVKNDGYHKLSGSDYLTMLGAAQSSKVQGHGNAQGKSMDLSQEDHEQRANLRLINGVDGKHLKTLDDLGAVNSNAMYGLGGAAHIQLGYGQGHGPSTLPPVLVTGHVVQGAMAQERLSSESLLGISNSVKNLSNVGNGGGEIRVRLKPENLGELNLRVVTHGNHVGLQIQASDDKAKKIIEESMSHLKESLAKQNLSLSRVEVSIAPATSHLSHQSSVNDGREQAQRQFSHQQAFGDLMGQNRNQDQSGNLGRSPSEEWITDRESAPRSRRASAVARGVTEVSQGSRGYSDEGRLDVTA